MPEPLRVGIIGAGAMGAAHARTIADTVPSARVVQVFDMDQERARAIAATVGATPAGAADKIIASEQVDAVLVASPDSTHAGLVLACLSAGKPVLCEKPLATDTETALEIVRTEVKGGRRLVQVGFMRRYDPGYLDLRSTIASGAVGSVRVVHAIHRNASSATSTDDSGLITGSMIHELDTLPWLLGRPLSGIRVESPIQQGFRDPQLATLWFDDGTMATVEVFVNAGYGYDVQCEVVGTGGTAALEAASRTRTRVAGRNSLAVSSDFVGHFSDAYRQELATWARSCLSGVDLGPSAWDGYVALVAARAGIASLTSGRREVVDPGPRPDLYLPRPESPTDSTGAL